MRKDWSFLWTALPPKHYLPMFFHCFAGETQRAFKDEQRTPTNTNYGIDMGHGIAECVKSRWKENIEKMKKGWVTIPFMMHWFAASPMVQLFVICQSHSTMQLRECKWCKLILTALTLINIELERHSESTFSFKANARFSIFFYFFFFKNLIWSTNWTYWHLPSPKLYSTSPSSFGLSDLQINSVGSQLGRRKAVMGMMITPWLSQTKNGNDHIIPAWISPGGEINGA